MNHGRPKTTEQLVGEFGPILDALMAPQEGPRQEAERHLRAQTVAQPGDILLVLALIGAQGVGGFQLDHRFLSLILLKRLAFRPLPGLFLNASAQHASAPFDVVKETVRARIETILCAGLKDEMNTRMRKGLGTCVAGWAEESAVRHRPVLPLPPTLIELTQSKQAFHRYTPFQVISVFPTLLVDSVQDPLPAVQVATMLLGGLHDPSVDVRVEAVKAVEAVLGGCFTTAEKAQVGPELTEACFKILPHLPLAALAPALTPLVDLAWDNHALCTRSVPLILEIVLPLLSPPPSPSSPHVQWSSLPPAVPSADEYDDWTPGANLAQEVVLALAYYFAPQLQSWRGGSLVEEVLGMMIGRQVAQVQWEGEADWVAEEAVEVGEWPAPEPADTISRLTFTCSHPDLERVMFDRLRACMEMDDWHVVCAGLSCFAPMIPNASLKMEHLQLFFDLTTKCVNHEQPRVRYAFLSCVDDLCHAVRAPFHITSQVIRLCLERLHDPVERVRAQAINSLADVLRVMTDDEVRGMDLKGIADALCDAYARSGNFVKDRALVAMGEIETYFLDKPEYVAAWSQFLLDVIRDNKTPDMRGVVVRAIECVTLPVFLRALCISPSERLKVSQIMHAILLHQNECNTADDPRTRCIVDAMATLANVTGDAFTPLVPVTVPFIFRLAAANTPSATAEFDEYGDLPFDNDRAAALTALATFGVRVPASMGEYARQGLAMGLEGTKSPSGSMYAASTFLVASMLHVAKYNKIELDVEALLLTLLERMRRAERGRATQFNQVHLLFKAWTDCVRIIGIPLPENIVLALLHAAQLHLAGVLMALRRWRAGAAGGGVNGGEHDGYAYEGGDGEEEEEEEEDEDEDGEGEGPTPRRMEQVRRTVGMIKDAMRAVLEVAGLLPRAARGKGSTGQGQGQGQMQMQGRGADMEPLSYSPGMGMGTGEDGQAMLGGDGERPMAYRVASVGVHELERVDVRGLGLGEPVREAWEGVVRSVRVVEGEIGAGGGGGGEE